MNVSVLSFQETYPQTAPIWFAESDDSLVSEAIEVLNETTPDKFSVRIVALTGSNSHHDMAAVLLMWR